MLRQGAQFRGGLPPNNAGIIGEAGPSTEISQSGWDEAILPGAVDTSMYRDMNDSADKQAFITNLHALKRVATPEELARSVLYLASDDSSFVSGTASLVDGGLSITRT